MNSQVSEQYLSNQDPDDFENNPVAGPSIRDLIAQGGNRRQVLKGMGAFAASMFAGTSLIGFGSGDVIAAVPVVGPYSPATVKKIESLAFAAVAKNTRDAITVPPGYTATVLYATGDSIDTGVPDYLNNGTSDIFVVHRKECTIIAFVVPPITCGVHSKIMKCISMITNSATKIITRTVV